MYDMPMTPEGAAHRLRMAANDIRRVLIQAPGYPVDIAAALEDAANCCCLVADDTDSGVYNPCQAHLAFISRLE